MRRETDKYIAIIKISCIKNNSLIRLLQVSNEMFLQFVKKKIFKWHFHLIQRVLVASAAAVAPIVKNTPNTRLEKYVKLTDHNCD